MQPTLSDPQHGTQTTTTQPKDTMPKEPTSVTNRFNKKKPSKPGQNVLSIKYIVPVLIIYTKPLQNDRKLYKRLFSGLIFHYVLSNKPAKGKMLAFLVPLTLLRISMQASPLIFFSFIC